MSFDRERDSNVLATRRRTTGVGVTLRRDLSPALNLEATVGYSRAETTQTTLAAPQVSAGATGAVSLTRTLPNGTASVSLSADRDSVGIRNTLSFGRALKTARGDTLAAELGLAARPGHDPQVVGTLRYDAKLPDAGFTASLDRSVSLNADNVDVAYTHVGLGYTHAVTALADLGLSLDWSRAGGAGFGTYAGTDRKTLSVTYSHDLPRDWRFTAGYQYRRQNASGTGAANSGTAFVTLGRDFTLWP